MSGVERVSFEIPGDCRAVARPMTDVIQEIFSRGFSGIGENPYRKPKSKDPGEFIESKKLARDACFVSYCKCSNPGGKFINFCGLSVETSSLMVGFGLNLDSEEYISVVSFKSFINLILFNKYDSEILTDDDVLYIIESLKIYSGKFNIKKVVESSIDRYGRENQELNSIILNCVRKKDNNVKGKREIEEFRSFKSNEEILCEIVESCIELSMNLERIAYILFRNMIAEGNVFDFLESSNKISESGLLGYNSGKSSLEALRAKHVKRGIPTLFLDSAISYGIGMGKRKALLDEVFKSRQVVRGTSGSVFNIMSSLVYAEVYSDSKIVAGIDIIKSTCYNLIDIIRAMGWDQDLLFAVEFENFYRSTVLLDGVFEKFGLKSILGDLGLDRNDFIKCTVSYYARFAQLIDWGSIYSRSVKSSQYQLSSFSGTMIRNSGRVFSRMSKRMLKRI